MRYREIRRDYQAHNGLEPILVDNYAKLLSPFVTSLLVRTPIIPNIVTCLMMASGVIGAFLFAMPSLFSKVLGIVFIHLWYIFDCSDGEVARIKKRFSKFGKEIDYTAHVINHPLFNLSFAWCIVSTERYDPFIVMLVATVMISAELALRNFHAFYEIYGLKVPDAGKGEPSETKKKAGLIQALRATVAYIMRFFVIFPNFVLILPIVFMVDITIGSRLSLWYFALQAGMTALFTAKMALSWIKSIVNT